MCLCAPKYTGFICGSLSSFYILSKTFDSAEHYTGFVMENPCSQLGGEGKKAALELFTNIESKYTNKAAELFPGGLKRGGKKEELLKRKRGQNIREQCSQTDYKPVKEEL